MSEHTASVEVENELIATPTKDLGLQEKGEFLNGQGQNVRCTTQIWEVRTGKPPDFKPYRHQLPVRDLHTRRYSMKNLWLLALTNQ